MSELKDIPHGERAKAVIARCEADGTEIPESVLDSLRLLSDRPYTERDIQRAHELVSAGKWRD